MNINISVIALLNKFALQFSEEMDELTAALAGSFQVTQHANNPDAPHPRFSQYKIKNNLPDQQERRHRILKHQKKYVSFFFFYKMSGCLILARG